VSLGDDSQVLRESLVHLLDLLAARAPPVQAKEIGVLVDRLSNGSIPSGLAREIARLFNRTAGPEDPAKIFAETAQALGDAMAQVAMSEKELQIAVHRLQASVPHRMETSDARALTTRARDLEAAAIPVRRRVLGAQSETALILEAVSHALAGTQTISGRISKNAGRLAKTFAENHDDVGLRSMRRQITQALNTLAKDASQLETTMNSAHARTRDLERRVEKQAAILGVLDSCRRIRKEMERYGDGKDKPIEPVKAPKGLWDPLTGVYSQETHNRLVARASRASQDSGRPLSLVLVAIEDMDVLARKYGQPAMDTVLKTLGRQLTEVVLETDVLSRVGKGRFALLLPSTDLDSARERSAKARGVLRRVAFTSRGGRFHITLRTSAAQRRDEESPEKFESRAALGLAPKTKASRR
jgi:diguanylate cyclase (GGDEF)-like protein